MQINDFKLALYGQIYDSEGLLYAHPDKVTQLRATGQYPAWINALPFDSRFLRELVMPGGECFSVRYNQEGLFYSYTRYNPHDARNGVVSIALYTRNKAVSNAEQLINTLRNLMDYFLARNSPIGIQDAEIESLLSELGAPYSIGLPIIDGTISMLDAYRVYQTEEDLLKLLKYAIQKEYMRYKWVHFVSTESKRPIINPALYTEINNRLVECYVIRRADGTCEQLLSGANYSFTFHKEGFVPFRVTYVVGQPSPYVSIDGNNVITPKQQNELNLKFKKKISINLYDADTNAPILENGVPVRKVVELEEGKPQSVALFADGYSSQTISLNPSKIDVAEGIVKQMMQRTQSLGTSKDTAPNPEGYVYVRKKPLIFTTLIFAFITLLLGGGVGYAIHHFLGRITIASIETNVNAQLDSLEEVNARYIKQIKELTADTLVKKQKITEQASKIQELESKLSKQNKSNPKQSSQNGVDIEALNRKALKYLNDNNEWSLNGMTDATGDANHVGETKSYKFLKDLVKGENLENVMIFQGITNPLWKDKIAPEIKSQMDQKKSPKIKEAIRKTNRNKAIPQNGELPLRNLYNNLLN